MPTDLPSRFRDSNVSRKRGSLHAAAFLMVWAAFLLIVSATRPVAADAFTEIASPVQP